MKTALFIIGLLSSVLFVMLLLFKRFYLARDNAARSKIQYLDCITSNLAIITFIALGFVFFGQHTYKIATLLFGLFIYLGAKEISGTKLTRWSGTTQFDANPNKCIFFRGRLQPEAIKLYFTRSGLAQSGTQYFVIGWLKCWGTILMTGVIPELLYSI